VAIFDCATCHNLESSLIITVDDGVLMELNNTWKWVVLAKLQLSYNELQLNCNVLHYIYGELQLCNSCNLFVFMAYIYNELEASSAIQKLSCKASCKTPFFSHCVYRNKIWHLCEFYKKIYKQLTLMSF
jgi:hypothetical protein